MDTKSLLIKGMISLAATVLFTNSFAAVPGTDQSLVCIAHDKAGQATATLYASGSIDSGKPGKALGSFSATKTPTVKLSGGETVRVAVCDYNPILFNYTVTTKKADIPDLDAVKKLGTALQTIITNFAGKGAIQDMTVGGLDMESLRSHVETLNAKVTDMTAAIALTVNGTAATIADEQKVVAAWPASAKSVQADLLKTSVIDSAPGSGAAIPVSIDVVVPSTGVQLPPFTVTSLDDLKDKINASFPAAADVTLKTQLLTRVEYLDYVLKHASQLSAAATAVSQFSELYAKVFDSNVATSVSVDYSVTSQTTISLSVTANATFAQQFDDQTKAFQKTQLTAANAPLAFLVVPQQDWHLSIAPGAIYSFVQTHTYSAKASGAAYTVAASDSSYAALSGAVALNITPDRYFNQGTQFFGQIGVVPSNGSMGFLLGGGVSLYQQVVMSVGTIYQQVTVLGSGLSVGSPLASPSALTTTHQFKAGLYIGLSVNLGSSSAASGGSAATKQ